MSEALSSALPSSLSPRPSRPRSISTTWSFSAASFWKASSPISDFSVLKQGLDSTSRSRRSRAGRRAEARMATLMRPTSGRERSSFSTSDLPR